MSYVIFCGGGLTVTAFAGGERRGPCVQFDASAAQMTRFELRSLVALLASYVEPDPLLVVSRLCACGHRRQAHSTECRRCECSLPAEKDR